MVGITHFYLKTTFDSGSGVSLDLSFFCVPSVDGCYVVGEAEWSLKNEFFGCGLVLVIRTRFSFTGVRWVVATSVLDVVFSVVGKYKSQFVCGGGCLFWWELSLWMLITGVCLFPGVPHIYDTLVYIFFNTGLCSSCAETWLLIIFCSLKKKKNVLCKYKSNPFAPLVTWVLLSGPRHR